MKWVLIIIGVIILLILVILLIGKLLPVKHKVTIKKEFKVSILVLWNALRNFEGYPGWRSSVSKLEVVNTSSWTEFNEKGEKITFGIINEVPLQKLETKILNEDLPFGGTWTFEIYDSGKQVELQITENGEVYSPIYRVVSYFLLDKRATMKQYISDLEKILS